MEDTMASRKSRVTTVLDEELALWLRKRSETEGRPVSIVVRDILARFYFEEEERFWARAGEERLESFDPATALSHADAWR
jgi:hypothetical protein